MSAREANPDQPADNELRCSPWTRAQGVDPIGSAGTHDALILVEWPLPWPADVTDVPELGPVAASADPSVRVMLVVPRQDHRESDGLARVVHHRRVATHRMAGIDHRVAPADVPALVGTLSAEPDHPHLDLTSAAGEAPPEVLVCGHGRRDPCCGRWGTLLHLELAAEAAPRRVWRCSHTGGHRYAPTAITLPDGRVWAWADAALLDSISTRTADAADAASHLRGSMAFDPWAQVVDRGLLERMGWAWLDHQVTNVAVAVDDDGRRADITLGWVAPDGAQGRADADVVVRRVLPVPVCGQPPDQAGKSSPEFALRTLQVAAADPV